MARGVCGTTGIPNFYIKRYVCPDCKRKGLYKTVAGFAYWGARWICMYRNCESRSNGTAFKNIYDPNVLKANPELQEKK